MDRRKFLKNLCVAGASTLAAPAFASTESADSDTEFVSVLVDITRCIGCRDCEAACAVQNGLPVPDAKDKTVFTEVRDTSPSAWTVVNEFRTAAGKVYVKKQCMHCNQAGCSTACLTRAMYKTEEGPVIWRESKCMGCRFCMVSCPFNMPRFEYDSANPKIQKCILCFEELKKGDLPACVRSCPVDALQFGPRREMLHIAHNRVDGDPRGYVHDIYGEHEVGGTAWLYISPVPFEQIGFRTDLGRKPVPEETKGFLYTVPLVFLLWPAFLAAIRRSESGAGETTSESDGAAPGVRA